MMRGNKEREREGREINREGRERKKVDEKGRNKIGYINQKRETKEVGKEKIVGTSYKEYNYRTIVIIFE